MILPFSGFECWALPGSWQQKTPAFPNAWNLCKTKKEMEEREREESVHRELIPVYIFILCPLDWSPTSCQLTRLTAILAERHRLRGTLIHPLQLSPGCHCLLLSKQSERGPRGPRLLELCFPISGAATFSSTNPCKRSLHYAAFHSQVLFFTREALSPNKTIHFGTVCVCVCRLSERLRVFFFLTLSSLFLKMWIPPFSLVLPKTVLWCDHKYSCA